MRYTFFVPGKPVGKQRPRFTRQGHAYTPDKTKAYETLVKLCWKEASGEMLSDGPIAADIIAEFHVPKRLPKAAREVLLFGGQVHKPDADNIAKAILDALNGLAYQDDSQVAYLTVIKRYIPDTAPEGVEVILEETH